MEFPQNEGTSNQSRQETDEVVAEKHGVSRATIERDAEFAAALDSLTKLCGKRLRSNSRVVKQNRNEKVSILCLSHGLYFEIFAMNLRGFPS